MSIKLITKVFEDTTLKPTQKLIMISLADNANDDGVCYPHITTICEKTSLGRTAVVQNLKKLEELNILQKTMRAKKKGGRYSNIYLLYPLENYAKLDDIYQQYFVEFKDSQSTADGTISDMTQSTADGTKFDSQSTADGTKLTIVEPSLIYEPSLKSVTPHEKVANYLLNKIKINQPNFMPQNFNKWIKDIDRAMRIDRRTERQLIGCIDWIYTADRGRFWISNIHSGEKLREKYNTMEAQMMNDPQAKSIINIANALQGENYGT